MNAFSDILGHLPPAGAYTVVAAAVLAESLLLLGFSALSSPRSPCS